MLPSCVTAFRPDVTIVRVCAANVSNQESIICLVAEQTKRKKESCLNQRVHSVWQCKLKWTVVGFLRIVVCLLVLQGYVGGHTFGLL